MLVVFPNNIYGVHPVSLPLLKPLLLTVAATSLVFFGGVIALSTQSPDADSILSVANPITPSLTAQPSALAALTAAQATALAKQDSPDSILQAAPELINYNGTAAYEVLLDSGTTYIDANFGAILNPVATNNDYVEGYGYDYDDDDDDDDDDHKDKHHDDDKHDKKEHHDKYDKENSRLIATSYQQYDEDSYDD
jgi:hypothetical protein